MSILRPAGTFGKEEDWRTDGTRPIKATRISDDLAIFGAEKLGV